MYQLLVAQGVPEIPMDKVFFPLVCFSFFKRGRGGRGRGMGNGGIGYGIV